MTHEALTPEFDELLDIQSEAVQVGSGFEFTEGPIWHPRENYLLFSDMPGDIRRRLDINGIREDSRPCNKGNGMTYDADLNLIVCEHSTSSVVRFLADGTREVLASHFEDKELNSPNDVCVASDGGIWFTDPTYGRLPGFGIERATELDFQGVYRIPPQGGSLELVVERELFGQPNGLCFSPDEKLLYINDTEQTNIRVFEVEDGKLLRSGRIFASDISDADKPGAPDGMKCDVRGNIWVTAPGGLWVYNCSGELIGKIAVPEPVGNFHWGGADLRTLYICATNSVYSLPVKVAPRQELFMSNILSDDPAKDSEAGLLSLDPARCALLIQDMQNDVVSEGGAFEESGSPIHCREQATIENIRKLADVARAKGVMVIHIWFVVETGAREITLNAPIFTGLADAKALVKGTWGAEPVTGLEPKKGDYTITKIRMSPWDTTQLETILKSGGRDTIINAGAWTNMSVEHTARTGADKGYYVILPEDACCTMNAEWHNASINYALQNVSTVTTAEQVVSALEREDE
jgi:gluconolactonase